jgi:putative intracellular protease/amidase
MSKILFVLTSSKLDGCGGDAHAGFFLCELVHPYNKFVEAGAEVTICSVSGGACHAAAASLGEPFFDAECEAFWTSDKKALTQETKALSEYKGTDFDTIFFVGGYGCCSDMTDSSDVARIGAEAYEAGGKVAAVCHGPAALINMKLSDGTPLVAGKTVCAFTNEEEDMMKIPLPSGTLEDGLKALGAQFEKGDPWSTTVKQSERLFTGQNPASAGALAAAILSSSA